MNEPAILKIAKGLVNSQILIGLYTTVSNYIIIILIYNMRSEITIRHKSSLFGIIALIIGTSGLGIGVSSPFNPQASSDNILDLEWEVYLNSTTSDWVEGITNDSLGNVYFIGNINSSFKIFICKYNSSGELQWFKTWRKFSRQSANGITIDSEGNIYITGSVWGILPAGYFENMVLLKFDKYGTELWNTTWQWSESWGGDWYTQGDGITVDSYGDIYVSGRINNESGPNGMELRMFLAKFNGFGVEQWNWTYGHYDIQAEAYDVAIDSLGQIYLIGSYHPCSACYWEGLLVKFNNAGVKQWNESISKLNRHIAGYSLFIDNYDNLFVLGDMSTLDISDIFLAKYDNLGSQQWNSSWGGSESELGRYGDIAVDPFGSIFIVCTIKSYGSGDWDICLVKFNESGIAQWYKTKGGLEADYGAGVVLDSQNNVYVIGSLWAGVSNYNIVLLKYAYDTVAPIININSPQQNAIYGTNAPNYVITIIEKNLNLMWYTLDGGETNTSFTELTGTINQLLWDNLSLGEINLTFYAKDNSGNLANKNVVVIKQSSSNLEEPVITGYDMFCLLCILSTISIMLSKKIKKFAK